MLTLLILLTLPQSLSEAEAAAFYMAERQKGTGREATRGLDGPQNVSDSGWTAIPCSFLVHLRHQLRAGLQKDGFFSFTLECRHSTSDRLISPKSERKDFIVSMGQFQMKTKRWFP